MSSKANKAVIGAFILGAICLVVAGVVVFGAGKFFSPTKRYVMYFDGSVKGLSIGAPVVFRGVKIGSVVDIILQGDLRNMTFRVPVIADIDQSRFRLAHELSGSINYHQALVDKGLRAQLQSQSLVTGQLMIDIDFHPDKPARFVPDTTGYPQIPTIPSTAEELAQKLGELPLKQLLERTNAVVGGLERLVNSPDLQRAPRELNLAVADTRTLLKTIDREVGRLSTDARQVMGAATGTINHADRVLSFEEGPPAETVQNINRTMAEVRKSLRTFNDTLDSVRHTASDERTTYQLRHALEELAAASRSLGSLVDYLDRHPEALLRGKAVREEE